jgi:hypothetical protein
MNYKTAIFATALLFACGCEASVKDAPQDQTEADITTCMRTVLGMDQGRWDYMGTIARLDGKFRTYQATSVHMAMGDDVWASKSFGGDVGGTEEAAEFGQVKLVGASMIPIEEGELQYDAAIQYISCKGPDIEGRYEVELDYKLPNGDGTFDTAKNITWYSEHGSYYAEDIFNEQGRVVARRSGVNTPAIE